MLACEISVGKETLTFDNKESYTIVQSLQHCQQNVSMHNSLPACGLADDKKNCKGANRSWALWVGRQRALYLSVRGQSVL